tara:strand:+ start:892 stop:1404 length:513 start_codon:yes stop_codon:yes gene_type:complete
MFLKKKKDLAFFTYTKIAEQSRKPFFFEKLNIPNNFEGRLEILSLNLIIILWALKKKKDKSEISQELIDIFFQDLDNSLRELGVSDLSVGKKIKVLVENFYGRLVSYNDVFDNFLRKKNIEEIKKKIKKNFKFQKDYNNKFDSYVNQNLIYFQSLSVTDLKNGNFIYKKV